MRRALARAPLVIGLGNRLRGDDALGPLVLDQLREQYSDSDEAESAIEFLENPADSLSLVNAWAQRRDVYLIDACCDASLAAGTVIVIENALEQMEVLEKLRQPTSSHLLDIGQAIGLSHATNNLPQRLCIYAVVASQFAYGSLPGEAVLKAAQDITANINAQLADSESVSPAILPGDTVGSETGANTR